jgi:hypothetical protein
LGSFYTEFRSIYLRISAVETNQVMEKVVMGIVFTGMVVTVVGVHMQQTGEREEMHKGVLHDKERIRLKNIRLKEQRVAAAAAAVAAATTTVPAVTAASPTTK